MATFPGLREQKRLATSRRIQIAVLSLSHRKGVDSVTVEEISQHAGVSPRTFFNYFSSKEAAVLGDDPFELSPESVHAFVASSSPELLDDLLALMQSVAAVHSQDYEVHHLRKLVIRAHPQLLIQKIVSLREFEEKLSALIAQRLTRQGSEQNASGEEYARLVALVTTAALKHAWWCWADNADARSLTDLLNDSFRQLRTLR